MGSTYVLAVQKCLFQMQQSLAVLAVAVEEEVCSVGVVGKRHSSNEQLADSPGQGEALQERNSREEMLHAKDRVFLDISGS